MSAQPLQERILTALREYQPVRVADLEKCLPDVDHVLLDVGVSALMRANKISRINGYYDLVERERPKAQKVAMAVTEAPRFGSVNGRVMAPPTAAEEAAANLVLADAATQRCVDCERDLPVNKEFQLVGRGLVRSKICRDCMGRRSSRGRADRALEVTHTSPPQPAGSATEPPAASSEHPSREPTQGTQAPGFSSCDPEALPLVGAGNPIVAALERERVRLQALALEVQCELDDLESAIELVKRLVPEAFA